MVNKVIIVGNVGQDPEIRVSQQNTKIATFSIATSEFWKDKTSGERKSITQWHRVVVFNDNLSNVVERYIKKGSKLYVEGSMQSRKYTGSDGIERNITEVVVGQFRGDIQILDSKSNADFTGTNYQNTASSGTKENTSFAAKDDKSVKDSSDVSKVGSDLDDEIPF